MRCGWKRVIDFKTKKKNILVHLWSLTGLYFLTNFTCTIFDFFRGNDDDELFRGMVARQKTFTLISSWEHCQIFCGYTAVFWNKFFLPRNIHIFYYVKCRSIIWIPINEPSELFTLISISRIVIYQSTNLDSDRVHWQTAPGWC